MGYIMQTLVKIDYGIMPYGQHEGRYFESLTDEEIIKLVPSLGMSEFGRAIYSKLAPIYEKLTKEKDKATKAEIAARKPVDEYFGNVGDNVENLEVKINSTFWIKMNGVFVISMTDNDGRSLSAFYNGTDKFKRGETCKINGIIRSHKEYRGMKQTGLSKIEKAK